LDHYIASGMLENLLPEQDTNRLNQLRADRKLRSLPWNLYKEYFNLELELLRLNTEGINFSAREGYLEEFDAAGLQLRLRDARERLLAEFKVRFYEHSAETEAPQNAMRVTEIKGSPDIRD
jgi:hypothetical protein